MVSPARDIPDRLELVFAAHENLHLGLCARDISLDRGLKVGDKVAEPGEGVRQSIGDRLRLRNGR